MSDTATQQRAASRHLNYRGDQIGSIGQVMGPNTLGEYLIVVDAAYDPAANRTRLGLAYLSPSELLQAIAAKVDRQVGIEVKS